jgi:molybdenum cofactor biosynthesis protein MoaC
MSKHLTHLNERGEVHMVDIGSKSATHRRAVATGSVSLSRTAFNCLNDGRVTKGDVLATARIAGIMAAKRTSDIIPLCHQVPINQIELTIELNPSQFRATIFAEVSTTGQTGVEMEALVAVSTAALTIYDMLKAVDRSISIANIELIEKEGGKSGDYRRPPRVQRQGPKLGDETSVPEPVKAEIAERVNTDIDLNADVEQLRNAEPRATRPVNPNAIERAKKLTILRSEDPALEVLFSKTPIEAAYMLGDLDPAYAHGCTWFALDERPLKSVLLLYSALSAPTLLSEGSREDLEAIILGAWDQIPRRVYFQMPETHSEVMSVFFRVSKERDMLRMGLSKSEHPPCKRNEDVVVLSHRDTGDIMALYQHYPDNFFEPSLLNTGMYFGIRVNSVLVSVAGIHQLSESKGIAAVGNIVTHPEHRGLGYATICVSHLVSELLERVDEVALNVAASNRSAIRCYESVGFKEKYLFKEGWASKHSTAPALNMTSD